MRAKEKEKTLTSSGALSLLGENSPKEQSLIAQKVSGITNSQRKTT